MFKAIIINTHGPDADGVRLALSAAEALCEGDRPVVLCVPMKDTAEHGVLSQVIPVKQIKRLLKGETLKIGKCSLRLESPKTLAIHAPEGVIIGLHGSLAMMEKIESCPNLRAVIMVPWTEEEGQAWRAKHNPTVFGKELLRVDQQQS